MNWVTAWTERGAGRGVGALPADHLQQCGQVPVPAVQPLVRGVGTGQLLLGDAAGVLVDSGRFVRLVELVDELLDAGLQFGDLPGLRTEHQAVASSVLVW